MNEVKAADGKVYALPDNPVWRTGPPPEIGWWPASYNDNVDVLRYWDGSRWSFNVRPSESQRRAGVEGLKNMFRFAKGIKWSDRWWLTQPKGYPKDAA